MHLEVPWLSVLGGALIGVSASLLLVLNGRVAGISGIVGGLIRPQVNDVAWRGWFVLGLMLAGALVALIRPQQFGTVPAPLSLVAVAGLLVGFGSQLGSGCTSGHGVCGLSRFSVRSLAATLTFMITGAIATYLMRHVLNIKPGAPA